MKNLLISSLCLIFSMTVMAEEEFDPFEDANRVIFEFNQGLDETLFEPVAKSYKENVPKPAQNRVSDFSSNIGDIGTLGNEIAQFELINSTTTLGRVLINSTVGLFGLFDVASNWGLEKTQEDFGQTLAVWGTPKGAYVVLPVLGSSTLRDVTGKVADGAQRVKRTKALKEVEKVEIIALQAVDTRVKLLPATDFIEHSDDSYIAVRSAYLQKRKYDIYNGNPPEDDEF
ncbi:Outer-membrane-phospholipid-binding lipoprotein MlaA [uncultured Gammaproteobacteria bacterium]|nr:Outer-membrane-phospholipid-binding lipoprotein MlaA [uncultured Gammaproteobacteria bacterium]CAC9468402.1 Outer-membrane-phospholipid-binding lipoprotein MlaA [uncultured Gammaproteobacteria bacterium]